MTTLRPILLSIPLAFCAMAPAQAQFPDRMVKIVVPQAPGGASDALARLVAQRLSEGWGQPVVVENRAGAGGNIGLENVARSPNDGYTLLMSYEGTQAINVSLYKNVTYDPVGDFEPVATIATVPFLLAVNNDVKAKDFKAFLASAKADSKVTYGSAGNGTVNHLLGEMLNQTAGTRLTHVPYRGAGPALTDLMGGSIDSAFASAPSIAQHIDGGKVRALAITSAKRSERFPDLPTIAESGYPAFDVNPWFGLFAPKGTPAMAITRINTDVNQLLKDPAFIASLAAQGASPFITSPAQFRTLLVSDIKKWATVVKESGAVAN